MIRKSLNFHKLTIETEDDQKNFNQNDASKIEEKKDYGELDDTVGEIVNIFGDPISAIRKDSAD